MKEFPDPVNGLSALLQGKINGNLASAILDKIDAFVCIVDLPHLKLVWVNKYISRRLGYSFEELTNLTSDEVLSFFQPCFQVSIVETVKHLNTKPEHDKQAVLKVRTKDNHWIWVLASSTVYEHNPDGSFQYLLALATEIDVTRLNGHLNKLTEIVTGSLHSDNSKLLSDREKRIIKLIVNGQTDKEIAVSLSISIHTAKTHRKKIIHKLCLKNSRSLIKFAMENGLG